MRTIYLILLSAILLTPSFATQVASKKLAELVGDADYIVEGKIIGIEMRDVNGKKIDDKGSATGPGITNQLFLKVRVIKEGFSYPQSSNIPREFWIPLWQKWHDTLAKRTKQSFGKTHIFLLKQKTFEPVYPAHFSRKVSEKAEIKRLLKMQKAEMATPRKPSDQS